MPTAGRSAPDFWQHRSILAWMLYPLSLLFGLLSSARRRFYKLGMNRRWRSPVPVIIVGNITVGGAGKTPLVIALARHLRERGMLPGIVCRGYTGTSNEWPLMVAANSDATVVGDEAVLLAKRSGIAVAAGPDRVATVQLLLRQSRCDVVISDDGLQHYALQRDVEVIVVSSDSLFGNGFLLPAGPLRERVSRLQQASLIVYSGNNRQQSGYQLGFEQYLVNVAGENAANSTTLLKLAGQVVGDEPPRKQAIAEFYGTTVHAVAAIASPGLFFRTLRELGLTIIEHPMPDHHHYVKQDLDFGDSKAIIMTEKDSVKCRPFATENCWYLPAVAQIDDEILLQFDQLMDELPVGRQAENKQKRE